MPFHLFYIMIMNRRRRHEIKLIYHIIHFNIVNVSQNLMVIKKNPTTGDVDI